MVFTSKQEGRRHVPKAQAPQAPADGLHIIVDEDDGGNNDSRHEDVDVDSFLQHRHSTQEGYHLNLENSADTSVDPSSSQELAESMYQALNALQDAGCLIVEVAGTVIQRQAATVNQRLLEVQERMHRHKRRKLNTPSPPSVVRGDSSDSQYPEAREGSSRAASDSVVSAEESMSIWKQAARAKRMSIMLRNLETTHYMLLQEIAAASMEQEGAQAEEQF
jgi:hypothetical protein